MATSSWEAAGSSDSISYSKVMGKRIMVAVIGAGMGALIGLPIGFLGGGNLALILGGAAGAAIPLFILGRPGR
jgi:hypothetical protein